MQRPPSESPPIAPAGADAPRRRSTAYNALLLAGGTGLGQLMAVAAAPALTRLYTPDDLGIFGLFLAFLGLVSVALSLRFESAIPTAGTAHDAALLTLGAAALTVPISALSTGVFLGLVAFSIPGYAAVPVSVAAFLLPALLLTAVFAVLRNWHLREEHYPLMARASFAQNAARALGQVLLGVFGIGWSGLFFGDLVGRMSGLWSLSRSARPPLAAELRGARFADLRSVFRAYWKFPILSIPSSILDALGTSLIPPLIAWGYGLKAAGFYALVDRAIGLPIGFVGVSAADAFHGRVATLARDNPREALRLFLRTAAGLLLVGTLPALCLALWGRSLFVLFFGASWGEAGDMAAILAPSAFAGLVVSPLSRVVFVYQRLELKLVYDVVRLGAVLGVFAWGLKDHQSMPWVIHGLNAVNIACYALFFFLLLSIVLRGARTAGASPSQPPSPPEP